MGLDITVYKIKHKTPKTKEERLHYIRLIDDNGNYLNVFPQWTKKYEKEKIELKYDWEKYKEQTGIDIDQYNWHGESYGKDGCFLTVSPKDKEYPEYHSGDDWKDYEKKLKEVTIKIDLNKVPVKKVKIKILYIEEVGYQRKGLNSQFYQDYRDGKIGYYVWDKKELLRYKDDYCNEPYEYIYPSGDASGQLVYEKDDFQHNIIDNFIDGECCVTFSW